MPFLLANWRILLLGLFLLGCSAIVGISRYQLNSCRAESAKILAEYQVLATKTQEQSDAINKLGELKKQADVRRSEADKKAKLISQASQTKISSLNAHKVPSSSCEDEMKGIGQLLAIERAK